LRKSETKSDVHLASAACSKLKKRTTRKRTLPAIVTPEKKRGGCFQGEKGGDWSLYSNSGLHPEKGAEKPADQFEFFLAEPVEEERRHWRDGEGELLTSALIICALTGQKK